jgi:hypothetical protein
MAKLLNLNIEQGATWGHKVTWLEIDTNNPIDLTEYSARMQVRQYTYGDVIIELTSDNGKVVLGGTAGTIELALTAEETSSLPVGELKYDLELVKSTEVTRFLMGTITVDAEITK